jgi:hypothetical protein
MKREFFFLVSCARSGSTSLTKILNAATNGKCLLEPGPNLSRETRDLMDGRLSDPRPALSRFMYPRIHAAADMEVYGEKNLTLGPLIGYLHKDLSCRFIFIHRDGRDVVRSLIDWHDKKFGTIYRECREAGRLTAEARQTAARLPVHLDLSDYSRPRPLPGDPLAAEWEHLSRFEMCAYYWSFINQLLLRELGQLPQESWTTINYTAPQAEDIERVADFVGLTGLSKDTVQAMLDQRINSLEDRGVRASDPFPHWRDWPEDLRQRFDHLAARTMRLLGYYPAIPGLAAA